MQINPQDLMADPLILGSLRDFFPFSAGGRYAVGYYLVEGGVSTSDYSSDRIPGSPALNFSSHEARFVSRVFSRLSRIIAIQPQLSADPLTGLRVASVSEIQSLKNAAGIVNSDFRWSSQPSLKSNSYMTVELDLDDTRSRRPSRFERRLIVHEIGHVLGLDHLPGGPSDPRYTDQDTIMSYNVGGRRPRTWYSKADIKALKRIWGSVG